MLFPLHKQVLKQTIRKFSQMILFFTVFWCVFLLSFIVGSIHQFIPSKVILERVHFQSPYYPWEDGVGKDE